MKRKTKLLLSILPISSISLLSLVSCSTTSSNGKQPNEKPANPNEKEPDNEIDKKPIKPEDSNYKDPNKPSNKPNKTPKEPEQSGNDSEKDPKKPDEKSQGDQPQNNQPSDQSETNKVDFSDIENILKEISLKTITFYAQRDAATVLFELRKDHSIIDRIFSKEFKDIFDKYYIQFVPNSGENAINEKGLIEKIKLKFTNKKGGASKDFEFTFTGFKIPETINTKNNKYNLLKQKSVNETLAGLFPSLIAYMLLYSQNHNEYKSLEEKDNAINFEELENGNPDLFIDPSLRLNAAAIKDYLFEYDKKLGELYIDKVTAVSYDDYNGSLGLQVEIENRDHNSRTSNEPTISVKYTFNGFRKVDLTDQNKNVLSLFLPQNKFKEMTKKGPLKNKIQNIKKENKLDNKYLIEDMSNGYLKQQIFKELLVGIYDNANKAYKSTSTLGLQTKEYRSILGLAGGMSIYPFHTRITKDSIENIYLSISKEENSKYKAKLEFEVHIPIFASSFSDLKSHSTSGESKALVFKIVSGTSVD
ncbi:LppA family lipoprotein [Mycoplasma capricolum]|uniref:LppA family lipoprotein n=1 Tax=Mycoplasma capricolum subsp. capricolum 14232 TaxID=1188238 RepID=A0A084EQJ6_MYCCA|nr:LppA family lipoprotein [Mycoplasma capricolum]KEZ20238.1 Hypothetical protein, predicted lipoprotein [Mycoplasma capricolum subsp. capricolum 14232]